MRLSLISSGSSGTRYQLIPTLVALTGLFSLERELEKLNTRLQRPLAVERTFTGISFWTLGELTPFYFFTVSQIGRSRCRRLRQDHGQQISACRCYDLCHVGGEKTPHSRRRRTWMAGLSSSRAMWCLHSCICGRGGHVPSGHTDGAAAGNGPEDYELGCRRGSLQWRGHAHY